MDGPARRFFRVAAQGLALSIGVRPDRPFPLVGFGAFVLAWALATATFALQDFLLTPPPREYLPFVPWMHAGYGLALLAAAWLAVQLLQRPAAWFTLGCLALIALIPWTALEMYVQDNVDDTSPMWLQAAPTAVRVLLAALSLRLAWLLGRDASVARRLGAGALFALLLALPWQSRAQTYFWYSSEAADAAVDVVEEAPSFVPEDVLDAQASMVGARVAALAPQRPGKVDLYAVGFAGDGTEPVFRNEVEYFAQLVPQRFDAAGRVVPLINHPGTVATTPIAALTNLRAVLAGIGTRMDKDEDVLLLFLTSHGSHDHRLAVDLPPLPLRQIEPGDLRAALDDAGIKWRVVVVSSCFSGGFIDALKTPETLVITAARADRTSFGCGADSEITYFGKAFLTDALNRTDDFREAYAIAARRVREWEEADQEIPSQPQIWAGERIDEHLAQWRAGVVPGPPLPFVPAVPAPASNEKVHAAH